MPKHALLIPTVDLALAGHCLKSFRPSLARTDTTAVVIYNGNDPSIESDLRRENEIFLGYEDSEKLAAVFASASDCSIEFLFGSQEYNRSYGGASNLLLACGYALGAQLLIKTDDDCLDMAPPAASWITSALEMLNTFGGVVFGRYIETTPSYLNLLPIETAKGIIDHCYAKDDFTSGITYISSSGWLKNGNLGLTRAAAKACCYPILFEPISRTNVRGEAHRWKDYLEQEGIHFTYCETLCVRHNPVSRNLRDWLSAIVVGFDLEYVWRVYRRTGKFPTRMQRIQAIFKFRDWIALAELPEAANCIKGDLLTLLNEDFLMSFTDNVLTDMITRQACWKKLVTRGDLSVMICSVMPDLARYVQN